MSHEIASLGVIPDVIREVFVAKISLDRISSFLIAPEVDMAGRGTVVTGGVSLRNATIGWSTGDLSSATESETIDSHQNFTLDDMSVDIPKGGLTLISGPLGSGKTLFVSRTSSHDALMLTCRCCAT